MSKSPSLNWTTDYKIFDIHDYQRPMHEDPIVEESMKKYGFMPSSPIQVVPNGGGKLKVIRGHHRLHYAKRLKLPVCYVIDATNTDIFDLEGSSKARWSALDFATARASSGDEDYQKLLSFRKKYGLNIGSAAGLVGGQSAGSNNKLKAIKTGTFKVGDMTHAYKVIDITQSCYDLKISFARESKFVSAVSMALRIPEFDPKHFFQKLKLNPAKMRRRTSCYEYLEEIESVYNYGVKKRIPIESLAREIAKTRQRTFGRSQ